MENATIVGVINHAVKMLKAHGVTKDEVINLIDAIAEDGQIDAAEAADLKRHIKAINTNTAITISTALASGAALILEVLNLVGVI